MEKWCHHPHGVASAKKFINFSLKEYSFEMLKKYKNVQDSSKLLILGIAGIILYKVWKKVSMAFPLIETDNFYLYSQSLNTVYRILATVIGFIFIKKYFCDYKRELRLDRFLLINALLVIPLYFLSRYMLFSFGFKFNSFLIEIPFNFFTGTFEEILFRAFIMIGLMRFMKPIWAILLSSLLFSLWHYDVVGYWPEYILIFLWGVYAGLSYLWGASLLSLCLFHFLWDQVFFGFSWEFPQGVSSEKLMAIEALAEMVLLVLLITIGYFWHRKIKAMPN